MWFLKWAYHCHHGSNNNKHTVHPFIHTDLEWWICVKICCSGCCSTRAGRAKCIYLFFPKPPTVFGKPPSLDRFTFSQQYKLDSCRVIHLRAQRALCAAREACSPHLHHTHSASKQVCTHKLGLCGVLTPLNHVMHSVSRHLDPLQADLYNGSAALPTLDPERTSVCMCKWSFVWPGLCCQVAGAATASNFFSHTQSPHRYSHCYNPICGPAAAVPFVFHF